MGDWLRNSVGLYRRWRNRSLRNSSQSLVQLRFEHLAKGRVQHCLRQGGDVIRDAFAYQEHPEVVGEIIAVVRK